MRLRGFLFLSLVCCLGIVLNGCAVAAKINGGGSVLSADGSSPAAFTANGNNCGDSVKGKVTLVDRFAPGFASAGGLRLSAEVTRAAQCTDGDAPENIGYCLCDSGQYQVDFSYTSTNAKVRGGGLGYACLSSSGKGKEKKNHASVHLTDGVYNGYSNDSDVSGNFNLAPCDQ